MRRCRIESLAVSPPRKGLLRRGALWHAVEAGRRCLKGSRHRPADIGVLVNAGVHRDGHICEPAIAVYIQHRLGINVEFQGRRTLSFDLLNGGCGMLNAAQVMAAVLESGEASAGLVVASEANADRHPDLAWPYAASGAALLMDLAPRRDVGFGTFAFETREEHAELYTSTVSLAQKHGRLLLRRRMAELEEAWLAAALPAVEGVLGAEGLRREQIDLVVPAQVSPGLIGRLSKAMGFAEEKVFDLRGELPDTLTTSVFLALERAFAAGRLSAGHRALLLAFASGITVGCAIYHC